MADLSAALCGLNLRIIEESISLPVMALSLDTCTLRVTRSESGLFCADTLASKCRKRSRKQENRTHFLGITLIDPHLQLIQDRIEFLYGIVFQGYAAGTFLVLGHFDLGAEIGC